MIPAAPGAGSSGRLRTLLVEANEDGTVGGSHQCLYDLVEGMDPDRLESFVDDRA